MAKKEQEELEKENDLNKSLAIDVLRPSMNERKS